MVQLCCKNTSIWVHVLVCLFGIGSWVAINGIWNELPIMVQQLPENWNLPSFMSVVIQLANIGPIAFTLANVIAPAHIHEHGIIFSLLTIGAISCLLLSFLWMKTSIVAGQEHSTALLVLEFFLAIVDCTSSVAFFPFMASFKPAYMTSYFVGEGFSGLLPSLVALGQDVRQINCVNTSVPNSVAINGTWYNSTSFKIFPKYEEPNFLPRDFFLFLFAMMVVSGLSFLLLNYVPHCKKEKVQTESNNASLSTSNFELNDNTPNSPSSDFADSLEVGNSGTILIVGHRKQKLLIDSRNIYVPGTKAKHLPCAHYAYFLILTAFINALSNGALPSIQSYSCLPYGNEPYHLSVTLGSMANPIACFIAFFLSTDNIILITLIALIGSGIGGFDLYLAAVSPNPPLQGNMAGSLILVLSWILVTGMLTYVKVSIATIFRTQGRKALLWFGAVTQLGSSIGAVTLFILINVYSLFESADPCSI